MWYKISGKPNKLEFFDDRECECMECGHTHVIEKEWEEPGKFVTFEVQNIANDLETLKLAIIQLLKEEHDASFEIYDWDIEPTCEELGEDVQMRRQGYKELPGFK